ncbi:MAG: hypothetical protein IT577_02815 [Verrucomicrobiae bacterium]|nr:hypothetical protein [Verrucomicrobiae bacterium]
MSYTTTCPQCGSCYDESSDEQANSPDRLCSKCWSAQARRFQERVPAPEKRIANTCRSCGREIVWLKTAAGKNMPVNSETVEPGDDVFQPGRHVSHFSDCPNAGEHRRAK